VRKKAPARRPRQKAPPGPGFSAQRATAREIEALRAEIERRTEALAEPRWNPDPSDVQRSVAKLVLSLVEFVRELLERQALRRMDAGTLEPDQIEAIGVALMRLEETVRELARRFGLSPEDLHLDLGPLGRLR